MKMFSNYYKTARGTDVFLILMRILFHTIEYYSEELNFTNMYLYGEHSSYS